MSRADAALRTWIRAECFLMAVLCLLVQNPESLLKKGDITRTAIKVSRAAAETRPALAALSSSVSSDLANSTLGADLTVWAADDTSAIPDAGDESRGVARKLFAYASALGVPGTTVGQSLGKAPAINSDSARSPQGVEDAAARARWQAQVDPKSSIDMQPSTAHRSPNSSLSSISGAGWDDPVSQAERSWWLGGSGGMSSGISRLMRSSQRVLANLRSASSSSFYSSPHAGSSSTPSRKQPKRNRASSSSLEDLLDRSAFGGPLSQSYDSIQRPRVLSAKASVSEVRGLTAHAGFFRPEDGTDQLGSPRSQRPPPVPSPDQHRRKAQKKRRVRIDSWKIKKDSQGTGSAKVSADDAKGRDKRPATSFSSRSPSGSPKSSPTEAQKEGTAVRTVAAISAAHESAIEAQAAANRAALTAWPTKSPLKGGVANFCNQCGASLPFASVFCPVCGRQAVSVQPVRTAVGPTTAAPKHGEGSRSSTPVQPRLSAPSATHPPLTSSFRPLQDRREREKFRITTPRGATVWATGVVEKDAQDSPRAPPPPSISLKLTPRNSHKRVLIQVRLCARVCVRWFDLAVLLLLDMAHEAAGLSA